MNIIKPVLIGLIISCSPCFAQSSDLKTMPTNDLSMNFSIQAAKLSKANKQEIDTLLLCNDYLSKHLKAAEDKVKALEAKVAEQQGRINSLEYCSNQQQQVSDKLIQFCRQDNSKNLDKVLNNADVIYRVMRLEETIYGKQRPSGLIDAAQVQQPNPNPRPISEFLPYVNPQNH